MDASVGLEFSLKLFQQYQRSGILRAQIRYVPGVHGLCTAYVHLTAGRVTACYVVDKPGQRIQSDIEMLCRIDRQKGPFEWVFEEQQQASPASSQPTPETLDRLLLMDILTPIAIAPLRWEQFNHWTPAQKQMLQNVWKMIDGKRTIQEIKFDFPFSPQIVDDVLQVLLKLQVITVARK